jgi:hypothetical protein
MAASATVTRVPKGSPNSAKTAEKITVDWVSASDGSCTTSLTNLFGWVVRLATDPAGGGSAPTDNYDITLIDEDGFDGLAGGGADRDTANNEQAAPIITNAQNAVFVCGTYTFTIANAGDTKSGRAVFYIVDSL